MRVHDELWKKGEDIGGGVRISYFVAGESEERAGIFVMHEHLDGELCVGSVNFDLPINAGRVTWQVYSLDPLHLEPSIRQSSGPEMMTCLHGFIRDGRWERCSDSPY